MVREDRIHSELRGLEFRRSDGEANGSVATKTGDRRGRAVLTSEDIGLWRALAAGQAIGIAG